LLRIGHGFAAGSDVLFVVMAQAVEQRHRGRRILGTAANGMKLSRK
jgi:hypothetical protein